MTVLTRRRAGNQRALPSRRVVTYTIEALIQVERGTFEGCEWEQTGTHSSRARAPVALTEWLFEANAMAGEYRARGNDGSHAQTSWRPEALGG